MLPQIAPVLHALLAVDPPPAPSEVPGMPGMPGVAGVPGVGDVVGSVQPVVEAGFIARHMPDVLLVEGPRGVAWWQWLALPVVLLLARIFGGLLARVLLRIGASAASRTRVTWDDDAIKRLRGPATLVSTIILCIIAGPFLELPKDAGRVGHVTLSVALFIAFFWALLRFVDVAVHTLSTSTWSQARPASRSLVPLGGRIAKVAIIALAVVAILASLGYPVASLLAGLGIGGLAVALAAQKTFENLFGAFAVGVDQPFRVGDAIRVDDLVGVVEVIGLRSTRIRTADRSIVTMPNGQLAEKRVETFAARDRLRFSAVLKIARSTKRAQLDRLIADVAKLLREIPKVKQDLVAVNVIALGDWSIDVEAVAFLETTDWDELIRMRTATLLELLTVVEQAGVALAYPTQALQLPPGAEVRSAHV